MNNFLGNLKTPWSTFQSKFGVDKEEVTASDDVDQQQDNMNIDGHNGETDDKIRPSQIASRVFGIAKKASSKLQEKATSISTIVSEQTLIGNIERERQKFMAELRKEGKCVDGIGLDGLLTNTEAQKHIIAISSNPKNLSEDPPHIFDLDSEIVLVKLHAEALFSLDPRLAVLRFELVPKQVPEDKFWRNYAYRISLVRKYVTEKRSPSDEQQCSASEKKTIQAEENAHKPPQKQQTVDSSENDEEKLENELLEDLNEFEVVAEGKKGFVEEEKMGDELDKQLDELLESA